MLSAELYHDADTTDPDEGFTLIELAVVIAVIAILITVALPTFLGVQSKAHHSAAEQNIVTSFTAAASYYATNGSSYRGLWSQTSTGNNILNALEPSLSYTWNSPVGPGGQAGYTSSNSVSAVITTNNPAEAVSFADWDGTNKCYYATRVVDWNSSQIGHEGVTHPGTWWAVGPVPSGGCLAVMPTSSGSPVSQWSTTLPG